MRVLFVISGLGFGGAERQVILLSRELARDGHAVSIYTLNRDTRRLDELNGSAVDVVIDQKAMRLDWNVLRRLRRHIRDWHADIVHGFLYDGDIYARVAAYGTGVPVLNSERSDNYVLSRIQRLGYRLTSSMMNGVVANSHAGAGFARELHRLDPDVVDVVWNGIDLEEIDGRLSRSLKPAQQIVRGADIKRTCMVGAIKPAKDHALAFRVLRRLLDADPSWRLICVGDELPDGVPGYKARALSEYHALRLEPFVTFIGNRRDVPEIVASCDLLLVTSLHEGFPNVVLEAMACGTAVASTEYSDVKRIVPFPQQVARSREPSDVAEAVLWSYLNREDVALAQRKWVVEHCTAAASAANMLRVYKKYTCNAGASGC